MQIFTCRYVIHILPVLLICFSDPVVAVRDATDAAARAIMSQLSGPGVKLVLPALMKVVTDPVAHFRTLFFLFCTSSYMQICHASVCHQKPIASLSS